MKKRRTSAPAVRTAPAIVSLPTNIPDARSFLQDARAKTSHERLRKSRTLAELEALSNEIKATIAFVKAQG